jgi:hypothetical protein
VLEEVGDFGGAEACRAVAVVGLAHHHRVEAELPAHHVEHVALVGAFGHEAVDLDILRLSCCEWDGKRVAA